MPGPLLRQNRQDRIINNIYTLYDALDRIITSKEFAEYAREIMTSAVQNEITTLNAKLILAESNTESDDDEPDSTKEFKGFIVGTK